MPFILTQLLAIVLFQFTQEVCDANDITSLHFFFESPA